MTEADAAAFAAAPETTGKVRVSAPQTGAEYLASLADDRAVFIYGERVKDVTKHQAFRNILNVDKVHYKIKVELNSPVHEILQHRSGRRPVRIISDRHRRAGDNDRKAGCRSFQSALFCRQF